MNASHSTHSIDLPSQTLSALGTRWRGVCLISGGLAMALALVLGVNADDGMKHFWHSYLLAAAFYTSLALGGLIFVALQHITRAGWSVVIRRLAEIFASTIPVCGLMFFPILANVLLGQGSLYIWNDHETASADELILSKAPYLNGVFFVARSVFYFVVWTVLSRRFLQLSLLQDIEGTPDIIARLERLSAPTLAIFGITTTFASIDWLMSLDPHWFSSIFGVYFFSGCMVGFLASLILVVLFLQKRLSLLPMVTTEHRHDLAKHLFGFTCFWAYIAFSQYLLIWYANVPEETVWFKVRQSGGWMAVTLVLMFGHFIVPFLGFLPRATKRNPKVLASLAILLIVMHAVDLYWLIFPTLESQGPAQTLISICCLIGMGGFFTAGWLLVAGRHSLVPVNDPRLPESLAAHVA